MAKELLVIMLSDSMVIVVPSRPSGKTKGHHILRCPGKVKSAVQFCQHECDDEIVNGSRNRVGTKVIQSNDGHADFQHFLHKGETHNLSCATFCINVVLFVYSVIDKGHLVHQEVTAKEEEIVEKQPTSHITAHLKGCRSTPSRNLPPLDAE